MDDNIFSTDGESQIYVGKLYLILIAKQMNQILMSELNALRMKGDHILLWLTDLKVFYDLIENQLHLKVSKGKIKFSIHKFVQNKLELCEIEIEEKEKYEVWFDEIEKMYERNKMIQDIDINNRAKYINDKKILLELSRCQRELYFEANKKHLIMPDVKMNLKELAKSDWIDRENKKELY